MLLLFVAGMLFALKRKNAVLILLSLIFILYLAYFSVQTNFQPLRYVIELEVPMLLTAAFGLASINFEFISKHLRKLIVALIIILFIIQGSVILNEHHFRGLSQSVGKITFDATIYTNYLDPVRYYRGDYIQETNVNNPFFSKFFGSNAKKGEQKMFYSGTTDLNEIQNEIDYLVLSEAFFYDEKNVQLIQENFAECDSLTVDGHTLFKIYGKYGCYPEEKK